MKVVLDTNCLLQIVFPKSCYKEIWVSLLAQEYTICLTSEIMLEYREILERRFGSATFAEAAPTTTGGRRSVNLSRQQMINIDYATVHILDDDSCGRDRWLHKNG